MLRLDLNVPINNSKIDDDTRINIIKPLIISLINNKAKIILFHILVDQKVRLNQIYPYGLCLNILKKKFANKLFFTKIDINDRAVIETKKLKPGQILLFENISFLEKRKMMMKNLQKNYQI